MPAWKSLGAAQPDQEYLALLTYSSAQEISDDPSFSRLREARGGSAGQNERNSRLLPAREVHAAVLLDLVRMGE